MTITKYDGVAILPKRCNKCNRLFWLEPYYKYQKVDFAFLRYVDCIECRECMNQKERKN